MEDKMYAHDMKLEDFEMPEDSFEEGIAKSFQAIELSDVVNLNMLDGAQRSEQSPDLRLGKEEAYEYKQTLANLTSIPKQVFEMANLRILNLSGNSITFLPDEIKKLIFLQYLDLSHNKLTNLPDSFIKSPWLRTLNISHNNFDHVPTALYKSAPCLRVLDISYNCINNFLRPPLCENYLETFILSSNELKTIPRWIFSLRSLRYVDLFNNSLTDIPRNFLHERIIVHLSRSIKVLNLQNCQITNEKLNFVATILDLESLSLSNTFDVDDDHRNSLQFLNPNFISRARGLRSLQASNVDMFFLHSNFDSLQNIQRLDLSYNGLMWLPNSFCDLVNLTECKLNSNSLSFLPPEFGKLVNLRKIFLSENNLVELPKSFALLINLEDCDLYDNRLEKFDARIIKLKYLKGIDLEENCLDFYALYGVEDREKFYKRYKFLKENIRKETGFGRLDGQKPRKYEKRTAKTNPDEIPEFVANYPSGEVYSLQTVSPLEMWDECCSIPAVDKNEAGRYLSKMCPRADHCCACKYCHFTRSSFAQKHSREKEEESETEEGRFDSD